MCRPAWRSIWSIIWRSIWNTRWGRSPRKSIWAYWLAYGATCGDPHGAPYAVSYGAPYGAMTFHMELHVALHMEINMEVHMDVFVGSRGCSICDPYGVQFGLTGGPRQGQRLKYQLSGHMWPDTFYIGVCVGTFLTISITWAPFSWSVYWICVCLQWRFTYDVNDPAFWVGRRGEVKGEARGQADLMYRLPRNDQFTRVGRIVTQV